MSDASAVVRGSAVEQPGGVGEQDEQIGGDQVGDQGGQPVVVAEADLVVGGGVVLVDHRDHAQLEQPGQGLAGVQVLLAVDEVERGEQDLAHGQPARGEGLVVDAHQPALAHRRDRLQRGRVGGPGPAPQADHPAAMAPELTSDDAVAEPRAARPPARTAARRRRGPHRRRRS